MPDVSVICTVKNGQNTIENTIDSVLNQTLTDWEFIIVDDGSVDKTLKILQGFSEKDSRIKIIETKGIGRGKALNLAVNNSIGKYIANIDADDLMHPDKLKLQRDLLNKDLNYFLISTLSKIIFGNETVEWHELDKDGIKLNEITNKNLKKNQIDHSSVLMRKDYLIALGGYDEDRKSQFDYELWLRAGFMDYNLGIINRQLVAKRIHSNQSFERKRLGQLFRSIYLQTRYIIKERKIQLLIYPLGRLMLGFLPFRVRQKFKKIVKI